MAFTLKKLTSWFLDPANVAFLLLVSGMGLVWTKRYFRTGRTLLTAGMAVLAVFANGVISRQLALSLEIRYGATGSQDARERTDAPIRTAEELASIPPGFNGCIVVLGGGGVDTPGFSPNNKLSTPSLGRIVEGVRLARLYSEATLIVSGAGDLGEVSNAGLYEETAVMLGITRSRILRCDTARDTMDEARKIRTLVGTKPFLLVTSAVHLPRAVALFRKAGTNPIPAPADYLQRPTKPWRFGELLWGPGALGTSQAVVHEYLGIVWGRITGKL